MKTKILKNQATNYSSKFENKPLKKWFVLVTVLLLTSFSIRTFAQTNNSFDIDNQSGCTWNVKVFQGLTLLSTITISPLSHPAPTCVFGTVSHIEVEDAGATCVSTTFSSPWSYSSITPTCGGVPPPCTSGIDCSGGNPNSICTTPQGDYVILRIF
jgi:hypothetical protein